MAAVAFLLSLAACSPGSWRSFNPVEAVAPTYDEDLERDIGWEFDHHLADKAHFIDDPVVLGFLNELGQAIVRETEPQPFVYRFRVIESRSLNAFAVWGGYIYFHSETLRAAGNLDELAGVMGHEVAHVHQRHHARMAEKSQIPDLVASAIGLAAIAGAAATGEAGVLVAGQSILGINEAIKLRFSRGFEAEADDYGSRFMNDAGYDPAGIQRFFERLVEAKQRFPTQLPPYLYSHPAVEDRIDAVEIRAERLVSPGPPHSDLERAFRDAQTRLALLRAHRRDNWIEEREPEDPRDPGVSFHTAERLLEQGRPADAVPHYRRTIELDPTRALVFFRLGEAYKAVADPPRAVYAFEQAARRAGRNSSLRRRAVWEIEKLSFPVIRQPGVGAALPAPDGASGPATPLPDGTRELVWWAELGPHFAGHSGRVAVHWTAPGHGDVHTTQVTREAGRVVARLALDEPAAPGSWRVEAHIDGDPLGAQSFHIGAR